MQLLSALRVSCEVADVDLISFLIKGTGHYGIPFDNQLVVWSMAQEQWVRAMQPI